MIICLNSQIDEVISHQGELYETFGVVITIQTRKSAYIQFAFVSERVCEELRSSKTSTTK